MAFINYKPQIQIGDDWLGNTQVFATKREAEVVAFRMLDSWSEATDYRVMTTIEEVNSHVSVDQEEGKQE